MGFTWVSYVVYVWFMLCLTVVWYQNIQCYLEQSVLKQTYTFYQQSTFKNIVRSVFTGPEMYVCLHSMTDLFSGNVLANNSEYRKFVLMTSSFIFLQGLFFFFTPLLVSKQKTVLERFDKLC